MVTLGMPVGGGMQLMAGRGFSSHACTTYCAGEVMGGRGGQDPGVRLQYEMPWACHDTRFTPS